MWKAALFFTPQGGKSPGNTQPSVPHELAACAGSCEPTVAVKKHDLLRERNLHHGKPALPRALHTLQTRRTTAISAKKTPKSTFKIAKSTEID